MDSNTSLPPPDQYRSLVKRIQSSNYLLNKQLQHICQVNGLRTSGVKAELQRRILDGKLACPFKLSKYVTTASRGRLPLISLSTVRIMLPRGSSKRTWVVDPPDSKLTRPLVQHSKRPTRKATHGHTATSNRASFLRKPAVSLHHMKPFRRPYPLPTTRKACLQT